MVMKKTTSNNLPTLSTLTTTMMMLFTVLLLFRNGQADQVSDCKMLAQQTEKTCRTMVREMVAEKVTDRENCCKRLKKTIVEDKCKCEMIQVSSLKTDKFNLLGTQLTARDVLSTGLSTCNIYDPTAIPDASGILGALGAFEGSDSTGFHIEGIGPSGCENVEIVNPSRQCTSSTDQTIAQCATYLDENHTRLTRDQACCNKLQEVAAKKSRIDSSCMCDVFNRKVSVVEDTFLLLHHVVDRRRKVATLCGNAALNDDCFIY